MTELAYCNPRSLKAARLRAGYSLEQAAKKLNISNPEKLNLAEEGKAYITVKQLYSAIKQYNVPLGFLYMDEMIKVDRPIADFRINPDQYGKEYSPNLIKAINSAKEQRLIILDLLSENNETPFDFNLSISLDDSPNDAAEKIRKLFPLSTFSSKKDFFKRSVKAIEQLGVYVCYVGGASHLKVDFSEFDGAAINFHPLPIILLNLDKESENRKVFSLYHELAHLALGKSALTDSYDNIEHASSSEIAKIESFCNKVAAGILVPEQSLDKYITNDTTINLNLIADMANTFKVSREVITIRLKNLKKLTQLQCDLYLSEIKLSYGKKKETSGPINPNVIKERNYGKLFTKTVVESYRNGSLTYFDVLDTLRMKTNAVNKILAAR